MSDFKFLSEEEKEKLSKEELVRYICSLSGRLKEEKEGLIIAKNTNGNLLYKSEKNNKEKIKVIKNKLLRKN